VRRFLGRLPSSPAGGLSEPRTVELPAAGLDGAGGNVMPLPTRWGFVLSVSGETKRDPVSHSASRESLDGVTTSSIP